MEGVHKWGARHPHVAKGLAPVAKLVAALRLHPEHELEARLGRLEHGRFTAGVTRAEIDRIVEMMLHSRYVRSCGEWAEEQDFFFEQDGRSLRTRVRYDSVDMSLHAVTICKETVAACDMPIEYASAQQAADVRVALKREEVVVNLSPCVATTLVRIKQRRRFCTLDGYWAFDFSMCWQGRTKEEAERQQAACEPTFEVECELVDARAALDASDDARIACSLLLKTCDLLPRGSGLAIA